MVAVYQNLRSGTGTLHAGVRRREESSGLQSRGYRSPSPRTKRLRRAQEAQALLLLHMDLMGRRVLG